MKPSLTVRWVADPAALGAEWDGLFAATPGLQSGRAWLSATIEAALPAGSTPRLLALDDPAGPAALLPLVETAGHLASLTTPYSCLYEPPWRPDWPFEATGVAAIGQALAGRSAVRFEALDPESPSFGRLRRMLIAGGFAVRHYDHFGNWFEPVAGRTWTDYLDARPGNLRETIRRKTRAAERAGMCVEVVRDPADLGAALASYEAVAARSWKQPEPFPAFNAALVRRLAPSGALRIGLMWQGGKPIAAQYWTVVDGVATVLKLAHDQEFRHVSPGTVLTAATIRELLTADGVRELDFGRGDDRYKQGWVQQRRPRVGLIGLNVRTVTGLRQLLRHDVGRLGRRVVEKLRRRKLALMNLG